MDPLVLSDGREVSPGERARGGSKNETRFGQLGRTPVVVKMEGAHGRLDDEARALRFLSAHGVRVPRVLARGTTSAGRRYLVISREPGTRAVSPDGWRRLGRDLATLLDVPVSACPFPRVTTERFVAEHRARLELIRPLVTHELAHEIDEAVACLAGVARQVVTHGDPSSGNYLDAGADRGTLLDWETASVSPYGLDLGRAAFIGLMDLGASGIPAQLVPALIDGYRTATGGSAPLSEELLHAWITVAGLQFIHDRHTQPLRPDRTPEVAANVLRGYLERRGDATGGRSATTSHRAPLDRPPVVD